MAIWRWLVWAAFTVLLFNAWMVGWYHWTGMMAFEVPSRSAIAQGHLWTLFTYVVAGAGAASVGQWIFGMVSLVFLFAVARLTEAELPHWNFLWLCAVCALGGSAVWLPFHWSDGASLVHGTTVLVLGLLSFWCFTVPDEAVPMRLFGSAEVRPPFFFWLALALEAGAFLSFELPQALGFPLVYHGRTIQGGFDDSAHLGAMLAGAVYAHYVRRRSVENPFALSAEVAPARAAAVTVGARRTAPLASTADQPSFANTRELRVEVDRILDKINHDGMDSLSVQERQTLDQAKQLLKK